MKKKKRVRWGCPARDRTQQGRKLEKQPRVEMNDEREFIKNHQQVKTEKKKTLQEGKHTTLETPGEAPSRR